MDVRPPAVTLRPGGTDSEARPLLLVEVDGVLAGTAVLAGDGRAGRVDVHITGRFEDAGVLDEVVRLLTRRLLGGGAAAAAAAAARVAAEHGVPCEQPVVLHDGSNLLVHLPPAPVVARVVTRMAPVRSDGRLLACELAVASHLAAAGAPAPRPSAELDPGPHERDGYWLAFWELVEQVPAPPDPSAAGVALRECHEALDGLPWRLPHLAAFDEALAIRERVELDPRDADAVDAAAPRLRAALAELPARPLHGDAHLANVLQSPGGPVWIDWEDACAGPLEWDLACLVCDSRVAAPDEASEAALAAYGDHDEEALALCVDARALQLAMWSLLVGGDVDDREACLRWLRTSR